MLGALADAGRMLATARRCANFYISPPNLLPRCAKMKMKIAAKIDRVDGDDGSNWIGAECCGKLRILSV